MIFVYISIYTIFVCVYLIFVYVYLILVYIYDSIHLYYNFVQFAIYSTFRKYIHFSTKKERKEANNFQTFKCPNQTKDKKKYRRILFKIEI